MSVTYQCEVDSAAPLPQWRLGNSYPSMYIASSVSVEELLAYPFDK